MLGVRRREPSVSFLQAFEMGAAGKDDLAVLQIAAATTFPYVHRSASESWADPSPADVGSGPDDRGSRVVVARFRGQGMD